MQLQSIIEHLESVGIEVELIGDSNLEITQISSLLASKSDNISFLADKKRLSELESSLAGVIIVRKEHVHLTAATKLVVIDPYYAYARVAQLLNPAHPEAIGIHSTAVVADSAYLSKNVSVLENAVISDGVQIGENTVITQGVVIGRDVKIGQRCRIAPNVTIMQGCSIGDDTTIEAGTVIGGDGFGWANHQGYWEKVPQIGRVIIGSKVSIGNNCTIDRGAIDDTVIADGCIIDNLVHIAHNVVLGEGCAIAGQVGFAGSTSLGKQCTVAGQAGFAGHLEVTDQVHILAKAGITHNITKPGAYAGFPAVNASDWQKNSVRARQLDKMAKQIKALEKQLQLMQNTQA
ncbi:MAG: UDP-3-O-(3-hydroxymyristoyl)glucosamine N-acyltransferase [Pseudomonadota bacterium]|nr:UDP-3-O-(3-hydroxymyristoyl)glucosamine N-acyltransferase [Pseudomonadota bacterium]